MTKGIPDQVDSSSRLPASNTETPSPIVATYKSGESFGSTKMQMSSKQIVIHGTGETLITLPINLEHEESKLKNLLANRGHLEKNTSTSSGQ
jgi:hypothetical protein